MSEVPTHDPVTPAAPRRRGRAHERHLRLLDVTCELIGMEGLDAVSHRRVAQLAGVPLGSTTYYFASREDMLVQALEHFARREIEDVRQQLNELERRDLSPAVLIDEFVAFVLPQLGDQRWRTIAQYVLFTEAARKPELAPAARDWNDAWYTLLETLFERLGAAEPELDARMFLGMFDGLLLNQLAAPRPDFEAAVLRPALARWFRAGAEP